MKFIQFKDALKEFTVFSLNDIKLVDPHFHRRRLIEWQEKGYIKKIAKGCYIFSNLTVDENVLFKIADMEKAVLDFFYLHPELKSKSDIISLRFNEGAFKKKFMWK